MTDIEAANALYGEKYRGAKMADLVVARYDLELRRDTERDRIFKELLDRDELEVVKPGETVGTRPGGSPVVSATFKQERLADRTTIWKQKVIEPEKYPEFHALEMETWWVECEVHHREILAREGK